MTEKDVEFFQGIAEQILLYCSKARINNNEINKVVELTRASFKLYSSGGSSSGTAAPMRDLNEDLQLHKQNLEFWTAGEMKEMPFLKDLKFRRTYNGMYQFRYRRNGYDESFTSKTLEGAKQKAYAFIKELKDVLKRESESTRGNTLDFVAQAWLKLKKAHTDKKTWQAYEGCYRIHIAPVFGKRAVKSIMPMDLQPFFDELFSRYGRTCEDAKIILNGIFKYAMANRLCQSNPIGGVVVEKHYRTPGVALTADQLKRFREKMSKAGKYGLAGLIILYTGIRGAELESLTFDWTAGTFTVRNAKLKKSQKANPGNLHRTVPIFPALWDLKDRIENEDWRIHPTRLTNKFKERWSENTVKDLRHTFSSKAREAGIDNELVNVWMGHSAGKNLTANTYTHFSMDFQKKQAKKLKPY